VVPDETLDRDAVLRLLSGAPERVRDYVAGLDEQRLAYRHGPAFPTLKEVVLHVAGAGIAADEVIRHACVEGGAVPDSLGGLELEEPAETGAAALERLDDLARVRRRTMDLLRGQEEAGWRPDLLDFCRLVTAHEMGHLAQVRNLTSLLPE
jgi:DinB family protein